jgi:hypothetical protein
VRDEQEAEVKVSLERFEQVEDLRLNGDVERRNRLVAHEELWLHSESARDPDPLSLAAGELVRIPVEVRAFEANPLKEGSRFVSDQMTGYPSRAKGRLDD